MDEDQSTRRILGFVAFICFIDMCGIGLLIPVTPSLIQGLTGQGLDKAAETGSYLLFVYAVMQFLFAPIIGGLSDRFGRRPVLLVTLAALGLDYALMAYAPTLAWLFVGRAISGVMGATWAAANSCVADMTTPETRGRAFGLLGASGAAGFVIGPAIGGLLGQFGDRMPFVAACVMALGGVLVGWRFLPETLPIERRRTFDLRRANPIGSVRQMAGIPIVLGFLVVILCMQLASQSTNAVWAYFNILKFGWTPLMVGLSAALFGALVAVAQGLLTGRSIARFGEVATGIFGLCCAVAAYLTFAAASASWMVFAGIVVGALGNMTFPAMQAMMTRETPEDAQGELQGAIASTMSFTSIIGPVVMAGLFGHFSDKVGIYFPGAPFLLSAALMVLGLGLFVGVTRRVKGQVSPRASA